MAARVERLAADVASRVVQWRRDFHQHPELGNREVRTAKVIADELRALGFDVTTGVAHTGVVGVLRGSRPGPAVALRSDMDGLPVKELTDLPFKSIAKGEWLGQQVGVMTSSRRRPMPAGATAAPRRLRTAAPQRRRRGTRSRGRPTLPLEAPTTACYRSPRDAEVPFMKQRSS